MSFAQHTCWDDETFDGSMRDGCPGCEQAKQYPCSYCGYGHVFPTHSPFAHVENEDPIAISLGEDAWYERFDVNLPYTEGNRNAS